MLWVATCNDELLSTPMHLGKKNCRTRKLKNIMKCMHLAKWKSTQYFSLKGAKVLHAICENINNVSWFSGCRESTMRHPEPDPFISQPDFWFTKFFGWICWAPEAEQKLLLGGSYLKHGTLLWRRESCDQIENVNDFIPTFLNIPSEHFLETAHRTVL